MSNCDKQPKPLHRRRNSWSDGEIAFLRANIASMARVVIASHLDRTVKAVNSRAKALHILRPRTFSVAELGLIRKLSGTTQAAEILKHLPGRSLSSVYKAQTKLGLTRKRPRHGNDLTDFIRAKHALGWSDAEVAAEYSKQLGGRPIDRHTIEFRRQKLGLAHNAFSAHRRQRVAEKTKQQLAKAGLPSIGHLRVEAFKKFARDSGWPEDLQKRETQILNLMWDRGPMTKREIVSALGMPWKGSRKSLLGNRPGGSYLATLMRRGMVFCMGRRLVRHRDCGAGNRAGQGKNVALYSLSPQIQRRKVDPNVTFERKQRTHAPTTIKAAGIAASTAIARRVDGAAGLAQVAA